MGKQTTYLIVRSDGHRAALATLQYCSHLQFMVPGFKWDLFLPAADRKDTFTQGNDVHTEHLSYWRTVYAL